MAKQALPRIDHIGVGARVEALRKALGLEKGVFAEASGIDASSYSKIIQGGKPLKIEMGYSISNRWSVSLDFIYRGALDSLPSNLAATIIENLNSLEE